MTPIPPVIWLDLTQVRMGYTSDPATVEPGDVAFVPQAELHSMQEAYSSLEAERNDLNMALNRERARAARVEMRGVVSGLRIAENLVTNLRDRVQMADSVAAGALGKALDDIRAAIVERDRTNG